MKALRKRRRDSSLVTIDVVEPEPDLLKREALLTGALLRVVEGTRRFEVLEADYEKGHLEVVVEAKRSRPPVPGPVSVHYRLLPRVVLAP